MSFLFGKRNKIAAPSPNTSTPAATPPAPAYTPPAPEESRYLPAGMSPLYVPEPPVVASTVPHGLNLDPLPEGIADEITHGTLTKESLSQILQVQQEEYSYIERDVKEWQQLAEEIIERIQVTDYETYTLVEEMRNRLKDSYAHEAIAQSRLTSETGQLNLKELQKRLVS